MHLNNLRQIKPHGIVCFTTDTKIDEEFVEAAGTQLKVVSTVSVGIDHINTAVLKSRKIRLGNTPGVVAGPTAEIAVCLALMAGRRIKDAMHSVYGPFGPQAAGSGSSNAGESGGGELFSDWNPRAAFGLAGKTCGILGLGNIGSAVAMRLRGFGINQEILYVGSSSSKPQFEAMTGGPCRFVGLDEMLGQSDLVFVTCSLNEHTRGLIGARELSLMKPSAALINVARGPIIDTAALVEALKTNKLAAAGLDVTDPEPLPAHHELLSMRNVIVLPHMGTDSREAMEDMALLAVRNLLSGVQDQEMPAEVEM